MDHSRELIGDRGTFNGSSMQWRLKDGRSIELGAVQHEHSKEKYQGRPHDYLAMDEAPHFLRSQFRFLKGWLRTTTPGQRCRIILTGNPPTEPEGRWIIEEWAPWLDAQHPDPAAPGELRWYAILNDVIQWFRTGDSFDWKNPKTGTTEKITPKSRTFIPAKVIDNSFLMNTGYMQELQSLHEPLRSQMLYGDFTAGTEDDSWQVIPTAWIRAAQARWTAEPPTLPLTCLGVDVAFGGADATVVIPRHGPWFGRYKKYKGAITDSGIKAAFLVLKEYKDEAVINVDAIGYGAACHEQLREKIGKKAVAVNVATACELTDRSGKFRLTNTRTAMYWKLREALDPETGDNLALPPDAELLADLTAARYEVRSSGIVVLPKDEIKERIGRSPDVGDAVALAHWQGGLRKFVLG